VHVSIAWDRRDAPDAKDSSLGERVAPVAIGIGVIALESTEGLAPTTPAGRCAGSGRSSLALSGTRDWEVIHHLIRKSGHFFGYGAIGLAWLRAWWMTLPRSSFLPDAFLALSETALVASCDEWHQSFLPNRTGSPWDVLLDCCGAIALQLAVYFICA